MLCMRFWDSTFFHKMNDSNQLDFYELLRWNEIWIFSDLSFAGESLRAEASCPFFIQAQDAGEKSFYCGRRSPLHFWHRRRGRGSDNARPEELCWSDNFWPGGCLRANGRLLHGIPAGGEVWPPLVPWTGPTSQPGWHGPGRRAQPLVKDASVRPTKLHVQREFASRHFGSEGLPLHCSCRSLLASSLCAFQCRLSSHPAW